jgi:NAD-dependent SIR2 family protein deacetylase
MNLLKCLECGYMFYDIPMHYKKKSNCWECPGCGHKIIPEIVLEEEVKTQTFVFNKHKKLLP